VTCKPAQTVSAGGAHSTTAGSGGQLRLPLPAAGKGTSGRPGAAVVAGSAMTGRCRDGRGTANACAWRMAHGQWPARRQHTIAGMVGPDHRRHLDRWTGSGTHRHTVHRQRAFYPVGQIGPHPTRIGQQQRATQAQAVNLFGQGVFQHPVGEWIRVR